MLVIRLRRGGKKHEPHFRIVVQEQRSKLGGKYIESLGHYHPTMPNKPVEINKERVDFWIKSGARASVTVNNLLVKNGILPKEQKISKVYSKKKKTKEEGTVEKENDSSTQISEKETADEAASAKEVKVVEEEKS